MLRCPLCSESLQQQARTWRCSNGHSFDIAKEGYCNLLPVQFKRSKQPGDNADMIRARQSFLGQGHYQALADALCQQLAKHPLEQQSLLDIGCGEGYYSHYLQQHTPAITQLVGIDISKAAVRLAAKSGEGLFFVSSSQRLPLQDASVDLGLRVFAPSEPEELSRVIKPQGLLFTVRPGQRHLAELKALLYSELKLHDETAEQLSGFEHQSQTKLSYPMQLTSEQLATLCAMTPFAWRKGERLQEQLKGTTQHQISAEFVIDCYQRLAD